MLIEFFFHSASPFSATPFEKDSKTLILAIFQILTHCAKPGVYVKTSPFFLSPKKQKMF